MGISALGLRIASAVALLGAAPAMAQQITGVPGSPSATTTIQGDQIPPPPQKFRGVIKDTAPKSKPYWPARVAPPKGAPNGLLIMTDDAGYAVPSTFGGVIPTPALDRIAANGPATGRTVVSKCATRRAPGWKRQSSALSPARLIQAGTAARVRCVISN